MQRTTEGQAAAAPAGDLDPGEPGRGWSRSTWVAVVATLVAIAPMLLLMVDRVGDHFVPLGDAALIEMRVRRVWSADTPLLGMYSRYGWYHPGPVMFWALSPFSLLAGGAAWGVLVGHAAVQAGAVVWSARVAWRRGGVVLVLAILAVQSLGYVALQDAEPLLRPWNPFLAFPFLPLFALLVWSAGLGDARQIPWALGVGSFLVQVHLGYGPLVAAGLGWMTVAAWRSRRAGTLEGSLRRVAWISAALLTVLWLPPLVEVVRSGTHANLFDLARYWRSGELDGEFRLTEVGNEPVGLGVGARVFGAEFSWVPNWLGGTAPRHPVYRLFAAPAPWAYLAVPVVLAIGGFVAAIRARRRELLHAVGLATLLAGAGVVAIAMVRGELTDFVFYWRISLALLLVVATVGAMLVASRWWRRQGLRVAVAGVLAVAIGAGAVVTTAGFRDGDREWEPVAADVDRLADQVMAGRRSPAPILLATGDLSGEQAALIGELERRGLQVQRSVPFARRYTEGRSGTRAADVDRRLYLVGGADIGRYLALPGAREVAAATPLEPAEEARIRELQQEVVEHLPRRRMEKLRGILDSPRVAFALAGTEGVAPEVLDELAQLNVRRGIPTRYAVVEVPGAARPPQSTPW